MNRKLFHLIKKKHCQGGHKDKGKIHHTKYKRKSNYWNFPWKPSM